MIISLFRNTAVVFTSESWGQIYSKRAFDCCAFYQALWTYMTQTKVKEEKMDVEMEESWGQVKMIKVSRED